MRGVDKDVWVALIAKMPEIMNSLGVLIAAVAASIGAIYAARTHTLAKEGNETTALSVAVGTTNTGKLDALTETVNKTVADVATIATSPAITKPAAAASKRPEWPSFAGLSDPPDPPATRHA